MGVLPKTDKLADVFLDLLSSQVGGPYVPSDKKLYVVSKEGGVGPLEKFLYPTSTRTRCRTRTSTSRSSSRTRPDQSDAQLARQAVVEATSAWMTYWLQQNASVSIGRSSWPAATPRRKRR
jgi:hypothetical protein